MAWFPLEFLIWAGLFVAMLLLNFVMQRAAARKRLPPPAGRRQQPAAPPARPSAAELWGQLRKTTDAAARGATAPEEWAEVPPEALREVTARQAPAPAAPVAKPGRQRYTRRKLLGSRSDLRKAIVLMTVLGPCRGNESAQRGPGIAEPPAR